ncbi:hypothetical protein FGO68_gene2418 [Halteria grandinella]|uniref:Uncharacterized protein n=1 Tax=Halteria grandinella TaxID=5974 RepID=A0A8J8P6M9_HALGN|nr:hypothetical protein FGO68_gene2418 [Halteria grandinella]
MVRKAKKRPRPFQQKVQQNSRPISTSQRLHPTRVSQTASVSKQRKMEKMDQRMANQMAATKEIPQAATIPIIPPNSLLPILKRSRQWRFKCALGRFQAGVGKFRQALSTISLKTITMISLLLDRASRRVTS